MGHMLKNTVFKSGSHTLGVPQVPSSSLGPNAPQYGQTRFNIGTNKLEFYANVGYGNVWNSVAREGNVSIQYTSFTGNGVQTDFSPIKSTYSSGQENQVLVFVGTVVQIPTTNYTFNGTTNIHFTSAPSGGAAVTVIEGLASTISTLA
jgi:hypothetical protein